MGRRLHKDHQGALLRYIIKSLPAVFAQGFESKTYKTYTTSIGSQKFNNNNNVFIFLHILDIIN